MSQKSSLLAHRIPRSAARPWLLKVVRGYAENPGDCLKGKRNKATISAHLLVCLSKVDSNPLHHGPREPYWAGLTSVAWSQVHTAHTWIAGMVFALGKENVQSLVPRGKITWNFP